MSGRFRNIGFSPEYALLTSGGNNQFKSANTFVTGSSLTINAGINTLISGATTFDGTSSTTFTGPLTVPAATLAGHPINKTYLELRLTKTSVNAAHYLNINAAGNLVLPVAVDGAGSGLQATTKTYVDTMGTARVLKAGDTMTGVLTLNATPSANDNSLKAATTAYVDTGLALKVNLAGPNTLTGILTLNATPTANDNSLRAATTAYVDAKLGNVTAGAGLANNLSDIYISTTTLNAQADTLNLATINTGGLFSGGGTYNTATWYAAVKIDDYGRVINGSTNLDDALNSTTLSLTAGNINLNSINTGGVFSGGGTYDAATLYDKVKVDQYGRVTAGEYNATIAGTDGWYNTVRLQNGRLTQISNTNYLKSNEILPIACSNDSDLTVTATVNAPSSGLATTTLSYAVKPQVGLTGGTYSKVTVNNKGLVTAGAALSKSDITTALGYTPPASSTVQFTEFSSAFVADQWGTYAITLPLNATYWGIDGLTTSNGVVYLPAGIYMVVFSGADNFMNVYDWWNYWWTSYWPYYYQPAIIFKNGQWSASCFTHDAGDWLGTGRSIGSSTENFSMTDVVVSDGTTYLQFGMPEIPGITYWYKIRIVKLK